MFDNKLVYYILILSLSLILGCSEENVPQYRESIVVSSISASSTLRSPSGRYGPLNLLDGATRTSWVEGARGSGLGQSFSFTFRSPTTLDRLRIRNGFGNPRYWADNNRVRKLEVRSDTGDSVSIALKDIRVWQQVKFPRPLKGHKFQFIIREVYRGQKHDDTALAEIGIPGRDNHGKLRFELQRAAMRSRSRFKELTTGPQLLDVYNLLPTRHFSSRKHKILARNGSLALAKPFKSDTSSFSANRKTGFLNIEDDGTGGGMFGSSFSLFPLKDKNCVAVGIINRQVQEEFAGIRSSIKFLKVCNDKPSSILKPVMPKVDYFSFVENSEAGRALKKIDGRLLALWYIFPSKRSGLIIQPVRENVGLLASRPNADSAYQSLLDSISYNAIELEWSKDEEKFQILRKF